MGSIGAVRGALGSLTSFATGPLGVALASIGGAGAAVGMIKMAANMEQTEVQFKTLLGSADAATQTIKELQDFGASTPFEFEGLASSAKTLLAFGTSAEQIIPTMQVLGDVASASGSPLNELANIFGKVKARGSLMTEQLDQFNERAIPVGRKLAEMYGKSEAAVRDMASSGKISFGDLQKALQGMTQEGGMAFNGMADQSKTLGGLWSTLKDNISMSMISIGEAMIEGFNISTMVEQLSGFTERVRGEWLPTIVASFKWMGANIVAPFIAAFQTMFGIVADFVRNADLYWDLVVTTVANAMLNSWVAVSTFFQNAVTLGGWFYENMGKIFGNLITNAVKIFDQMTGAIAGSWDNLMQFMEHRNIGALIAGQVSIATQAAINSTNLAFEGIEMPTLAKGEYNQMESDFDSIQNEFDKRQKARDEAAKAAATEKVAIAKSEFEVSTASASGSKKDKKSDAFQMIGFAQLADQAQQAAAANRERKEELGIAKEAKDSIKELNEKANGQGIKVVMTGGGAVQTPSQAFGSAKA